MMFSYNGFIEIRSKPVIARIAHRFFNKELLVLLILLLLPLTSTYAASIDFNKMLYTLKENSGPLIRFVAAIAYVMGIWFILSAVMALKRVGQTSMYMQNTGLITAPLVKMLVGVLLLYLPNTIDVGVWTIWGYGALGSEAESVMAYSPSMGDPFGPAKEGAIAIVRLVGYVSFVRGLVILSNAANQNAQAGTFGKGLVHVVGGILAINIVGTIRILSNTLGFGEF